MSEIKNEHGGYTADGYICDQDYLTDYKYRTMSADINGCGPVAAYNLQKFLGEDCNFDAIRHELDMMHPLRLPGPTTMVVMRKYLNEHIAGIEETVGREEAIAKAKESRAGIFRYREKKVPHFISYIDAGGGKFRFFNVDDGIEDKIMSMDEFAENHLLGGTVIVFTVK